MSDNNDGQKLINALKENNLNEVEKLLKQDGINVNAKDNEGKTPLWIAAQNGNKEIVRALIAKPDIDVNAKDEEGKTALRYAKNEDIKQLIIKKIEYEIIKEIKKQNPKINTIKSLLNSIEAPMGLYHAALNGHIEIVKIFIEEENTNVNRQDGNGFTALMYATIYQKIDVVKYLLEKGANVNAVDSEGKTALYYASENRNDKIIKLLKEAIEKLKSEGGIKMIELLKNRKEEEEEPIIPEVKKLLEKYGKITTYLEYEDGYKDTPLHIAAEYGYNEIIKLFLKIDEYGNEDKIKYSPPNPNIKNIFLETPLYKCLSSEFWDSRKVETVDLLLKGGADPNIIGINFRLWYVQNPITVKRKECPKGCTNVNWDAIKNDFFGETTEGIRPFFGETALDMAYRNPNIQPIQDRVKIINLLIKSYNVKKKKPWTKKDTITIGKDMGLDKEVNINPYKNEILEEMENQRKAEGGGGKRRTKKRKRKSKHKRKTKSKHKNKRKTKRKRKRTKRKRKRKRTKRNRKK